jgi:hypothetical protein
MKAIVLVSFDAQAAAALVASVSASTAIQMLLAVGPGVGLVLSLVVAYQAGRMTNPEHPEHNTHSMQFVFPLVLLSVALLVPACLQFPIASWWGALLPVTAALYAFGAGRSRNGWGYISVIFGLVVIVVIQSVYSGSMWLPKERLVVNGTDYLVYVTSESDSSLVAYLPANNAVLRLPSPGVGERQYCNSNDEQTIGTWWRGAPSLPMCPEADIPFPVR